MKRSNISGLIEALLDTATICGIEINEQAEE